MNLHEKKVAVVGFGTMGQALVAALLKDEAVKAANIVATVAHKESAERLGESSGVCVGTDLCVGVRGRPPTCCRAGRWCKFVEYGCGWQ